MAKSNIYLKSIIAGLILGIGVFNLTASANDINKLDIKKSNSSGSALNVTIYTENPYDENVAVTQKGDNKYVILMPNVSGSRASNVDLSAIKDIVTDVNVKSMSDGYSGYTKVTLTTTKPVSISTSSKKSVPLTEEQKAYKNLIAQSRTHANSNNQSQMRPKASVETENILASVLKDANKNTSTSHTSASNVQANTVQKIGSTETQKSNSVLSKIKDMVDSSSDKKNVSNAKLNDEKVINLPELNTSFSKNPVKKDIDIIEVPNKSNMQSEISANSTSELSTKPEFSDNITGIEEITDITTNENISTTESNKQYENNFHNQSNNEGFNKTMLTTLIILLSALMGILALFRAVKQSVEHSVALKQAFKENLKDKPHANVADFSDIATDSSLSWQEKYQKFVNSIEEIKPEDGLIKQTGNGEYEFVNSVSTPDNKDHAIKHIFQDDNEDDISGYSAPISNLKPMRSRKPKLKSHNKPALNKTPKAKPVKKTKHQSLKSFDSPRLEIVERKSEAVTELDFKKLVSKLNRTLNNSPSQERLPQNTNEDVISKQFENSLNGESVNTVPVHKEEDAIDQSIRKSPKLKSFAHKTALEKNIRRSTLPKRHKEVVKPKNIESKYVNLEESPLYSSVRKFKDGNLSSVDLISGNAMGQRISIPNAPAKETVNNTDYSMATIEEFFDDTGKNYATAPASLSNRVADRLAKMGNSKVSKPILTNQHNNVSDPFSGKIIRSAYNIDNQRGFYIVSDETGRCTLLGKINNETFVLKEFANSIKYKLQVRKDEQNVYMIRVGAERFLVEVSYNKMGVLLEL